MKANYFSIIDHQEIDVEALGMPNAVKGMLQIVIFKAQDLGDPKTEPIGVFFQDGNRKYLWRDKYWAEYDLPTSQTLERLDLAITALKETDNYKRKYACQKAYDLISEYRFSLGPTDKDCVDHAATVGRIYRRVLYEVPT